jgi:serine/threonine protein kinase
VHRHIKPSNVLYEVETGRVLISDLGSPRRRPVDEVLSISGAVDSALAAHDMEAYWSS